MKKMVNIIKRIRLYYNSLYYRILIMAGFKLSLVISIVSKVKTVMNTSQSLIWQRVGHALRIRPPEVYLRRNMAWDFSCKFCNDTV